MHYSIHCLCFLQGLVVLGIVLPDSLSSTKFSASLCVTEPLNSLILSQDFNYSADIQCSPFSCKQKTKHSKNLNLSSFSKTLLSKLASSLQKAVYLAQEKGASSWLTALSEAGINFIIKAFSSWWKQEDVSGTAHAA